MTRLDPSSSLYEALVHPIIECLRKDIEGYTQYVQSTAQDLARITFPFASSFAFIGPRAEASDIGQDLDAVEQLYPEYSDSCTAVLKLRPPSSVKWLHDEGTVTLSTSIYIIQVARYQTSKDYSKTSSKTESRPHTFRNVLSGTLSPPDGYARF
ncbi:hypothetical protein FRC19_000645 [Serendipita sp. 401]|nr:hypothetical protein FRC19_000645 [Serendipita sp. 401]